jgi:hypothetical protein
VTEHSRAAAHKHDGREDEQLPETLTAFGRSLSSDTDGKRVTPPAERHKEAKTRDFIRWPVDFSSGRAGRQTDFALGRDADVDAPADSDRERDRTVTRVSDHTRRT